MKERSSSKNLGSPEGRNSRKREESITNEDEERKHKRRRQSRDSSSSSSSSSSCSSSSSDSSSDSDKDDKKRKRSKKDKKKDKKKERKKMKKEKKRLKKLLKKEKKKLKKEKKKEQGSSAAVREIPESKSPEQSEDKELETHLLEASRARAPMTKEEWEKQQSVIRRVYDPDTGRHRLVKGTGEILEECVSRERHLAINKAATKGDGDHFQSTIMSKAKD